MEVTLKLSEENIDAIAQRVFEIQSANKTDEKSKLDNSTLTLSVKDVSKITNRDYTTILRHLNNDPPILIGKKSGKRWIITAENLDRYINI